MGRLAKTKVDEIAKLRKEGYTQKEIAERLHVHPRTVRRYDPLHQDRLEERSVKDRLSAVEDAIRTCWDYIDLLYAAMCNYPALRKILEDDTYSCPRCEGKLRYDEEKVTYICSKCGHKFSIPYYWCYHCLSQAEMDYVEETDDWVCRKCGARRYGPKA